MLGATTVIQYNTDIWQLVYNCWSFDSQRPQSRNAVRKLELEEISTSNRPALKTVF